MGRIMERKSVAMKPLGFVMLLSAWLSTVSCSNYNSADRAKVPNQRAYEEAYVYGFPMIAAYKAMYQFNVDKTNSQYKAPFNQIWSESQVFTPKDTAISTPNNDTPYSMVQVDLRAEPIVFCVPEMKNRRYYSVQLTDMYTFNYGYVGSRATGNDGGCYVVAGPEWKRDAPTGIKKAFRSETEFSLITYRTQLFNESDVENVKKIQAGYSVEPLSAFLHQAAPSQPPTPDFPVFTEDAYTLDFPKYLNFLFQFCPSVPEETALRSRFATVGLEVGKPFDPGTLSQAQRVEIEIGGREGYEAIANQRRHIGKDINGWNITAIYGDRAFYHGNYLLRAAAVLAGIYGNDAVEAVYALAKTTGDGIPLDGSKHKYTLTFAAGQLPPVRTFWSLTVYDGNTRLLIPNPINRYLVNSQLLPDMKTNKDGSLTICIQRDAPPSDKRTNWLPVSDGPIYMVMRLYWPKEAPPSILPLGSATWNPPAVRVVQ
jgi:hypothetical protein